jgi:hypothetical protein
MQRVIREMADWKGFNGSPKLHLLITRASLPGQRQSRLASAAGLCPAKEKKSMRTRYLRFASAMGALALAFLMIPSAVAQCGLGLGNKPIKPSSWNPDSGPALATLLPAGYYDSDDHKASIVGMWHVVFTAETMNKAPFSGVIDNAVVVFHTDGTEIMNSARPAQDGAFCLGVWEPIGKNKYFLNHIPWLGNDTTNAPSGIGNPQGGAQILEEVEVSPTGNSYTGTFKLTAYDPTGKVTVTFTGALKGTRITTSTSFSDLL